MFRQYEIEVLSKAFKNQLTLDDPSKINMEKIKDYVARGVPLNTSCILNENLVTLPVVLLSNCYQAMKYYFRVETEEVDVKCQHDQDVLNSIEKAKVDIECQYNQDVLNSIQNLHLLNSLLSKANIFLTKQEEEAARKLVKAIAKFDKKSTSEQHETLMAMLSCIEKLATYTEEYQENQNRRSLTG